MLNIITKKHLMTLKKCIVYGEQFNNVYCYIVMFQQKIITVVKSSLNEFLLIV